MTNLRFLYIQNEKGTISKIGDGQVHLSNSAG
jgi:hypothetical protein